MVVDNKRIYYYTCPNCEWRILNNQIKEISGFEDKIHFCEYCGSKLEKINFENSDETEETKSETKNSIEYPIEIIVEDPDFQIGFIDNLTLVLSRMIYFNIRYLEKTLDKKIDNIELDWQLLNLLSGALMPILQNGIEEVFLDKLDQITLADFHSNLAKLHVKVKSFQIFRQRFIVYMRWLIKQVFILVSESWNKGSIDKFEAMIFRDLNTYDFNKIQSKLISLGVKNNVTENEDNNKVKNTPNSVTKEEVEFLEDHNIDITELSSRWAWVDINPNLMEKFFYEVIYPKFNYIPDAKQIREIGYRSFLRKFREYGGIWTKVKEKGSFYLPTSSEERLKSTWRDFSNEEKIFFKRHKIFMKDLKSRWDWGRNNKELILSFFREVIYTQLGYVPKKKDIIDLGFRGIIRIIREMGLTFSNIISEAFNDEKYIFQEKTTWKYFTPQEISFFNKYKINWEKLKSRWDWAVFSPELIKEFYKEIIIPIKGRIPTLNEIKDMGFRGLLAICYSDFDYLELINDISNELYGKDYNFVRNIPIHIIDKIFEVIKVIITNFIEKGHHPRSINYLSAQLNVSWCTFYEHTTTFLVDNYGSKKGLELLSLMWSYQDMKFQRIGIKIHILVSDLLTLFLKQLGHNFLGFPIKYFREPLIFSYGFHPDGLILLTRPVSNFLKSYHPFFHNVIKHDFKGIIFDYSIDASEKNLKKKARKYGKENILLIIVSLRDKYIDGIRSLPYDVRELRDNVKIIDYHFLKELFIFPEYYIKSFDYYIQLVCKEDLTKLSKIKNIPSDERFTTTDLKSEIRKISGKDIIDFFS